MEFVILLVVLFNRVDGTAEMAAVPTPNHQVCEEMRREIVANSGPLSDGQELRARCISTEQLAPSV